MLIPEKWTFIFTALNLLVLYFFMKRILFKPITNFMENRQNSIQEALDNAEQAKIEAAEVRKNYDEKIKNVKDDCDKILSDARLRATREYNEMIDAAKLDSEGIIERGRLEVEREREEMMRQAKKQIAALAILAATKVVEANMDSDSNRSMVNKFIDGAGAA